MEREDFKREREKKKQATKEEKDCLYKRKKMCRKVIILSVKNESKSGRGHESARDAHPQFSLERRGCNSAQHQKQQRCPRSAPALTKLIESNIVLI